MDFNGGLGIVEFRMEAESERSGFVFKSLYA